MKIIANKSLHKKNMRRLLESLGMRLIETPFHPEKDIARAEVVMVQDCLLPLGKLSGQSQDLALMLRYDQRERLIQWGIGFADRIEPKKENESTNQGTVPNFDEAGGI